MLFLCVSARCMKKRKGDGVPADAEPLRIHSMRESRSGLCSSVILARADIRCAARELFSSVISPAIIRDDLTGPQAGGAAGELIALHLLFLCGRPRCLQLRIRSGSMLRSGFSCASAAAAPAACPIAIQEAFTR